MATKTHGSPELDADAAKLEALGADTGLTLEDLDDDGMDDDLYPHGDDDGDGSDSDGIDPDRSSLNVGELLSKDTTRGLSDEIKGEKLSAQSRGMLEAIIVVAKSRCDNAFLSGAERSEANLDLEILTEAIAALPADIEAGSDSSPSNEEQKPEPTVASLGELREIPVDDIDPDPDQPREAVDDELWASIAANGVLQPIVVRPHPNAGKFDAKFHRRAGAETPPFMIVDGERRWRGARKAELSTIPARVMNAADDEGDRLLHQVVFNEGKRLTPMEEARSWKRIMTAKGWTAQQLAKALGRGKSTVSDRLALLDAPPAFQALLIDGTLSAAAAPIIRQYAHLPAPILEKLLTAAENNYGWRQDVQAGKSVSLATVGASLANALGYPFTEVEGIGKDYDGESFVVNKKTYAVDRSAYLAHVQDKRDAAVSGKKVKAADDYQAAEAERNRKRRRETERKRVLRRAQFSAISAKLPAVVGRDGALFLIGALATEMQQLSQIAACKGLSIEMPKKSLYGADHKKLLMAHAAKLDGAGRIRMLFQLAMATDLQVSEYEGVGSGGGAQLAAAAALVKLDLKKVKAPVDEKSKVAPAKKSPAKSTPKKRR